METSWRQRDEAEGARGGDRKVCSLYFPEMMVCVCVRREHISVKLIVSIIIPQSVLNL